MPFYQTKQRIQNLTSKLSKTHLLATIAILLAIPITVILSGQQQNLRKEASQKSSVKAASSKPNIVIIMLDDVSPMDGRFFTAARTPNIYDTIISKGITFTNFYTETTLCCPGRAGYLTGQHTQNHGVDDLQGVKLNPDTTIATELTNSNYYTALIGKYLNEYKGLSGTKLDPPGWSALDAFFANNTVIYDYRIRSKDGTLTSYGSSPSDYSTDVVSEFAIKRMKEANASTPNNPYFFYVSPSAIHGPHISAPRHIGDARCTNIGLWKPSSFNEADVSDKSKYIRDLPLREDTNGYDITIQCEMILSVDDMVGKISAELTTQGRLDNTVFILTADNGFSFGEHRLPGKTVPYATHVPLYISWPAGRGVTPRTDETVLSNIDIAPTLCELGGCVMGPYPNGQTIADGISFANLIKNQPNNIYRDAILESQPIAPENAGPTTRPSWWAIRTTEQNLLGKWHYIEYATGERELYDLSGGPCYLWTADKGGDPCELENLLRSDKTPSSQAQEMAVKLKARLNQLKNEKGFVPPVPISPTPTPTVTPTPGISITPTPTPTKTPTPAPVTTITIQIKADSFVRNTQPSSNFGTSSTLNSKAVNPNQIAFFKFTLPNLSGKTVTKAVLRLRTSNSPSSAVGSANKLEVKSVPNSWTESNLTYNSKPVSGQSLGTKLGKIAANTIFDIDITPGLLGKTGGDISFVLESTGTNENSLQILSKESSSGKPILVLTYK